MTALAKRPQTSQMPVANGDRRMSSIKDLFEAAKSKIAAVAPKHLSPDRLMRVALLTISKTPALAKCTPMSLLNSFMTASQLGLEIGGVLGEAYLVPYKEEATFILGYRGMINLARRSGQIICVESQVVREGDRFEFEYGLEMKFSHKPAGNSSAQVTHVWALARFKDGGHQLDVMTKAEVDAIRARSRAGNSGPWVTDYAEMAKKTVVRRLCKYLPLSPEMADAIESSDRSEFGDFIDGEAVEAAETKAAEKVASRRKADRLADELTQPDPSPEPESQEAPEIDTAGADTEPPPVEQSQLDEVTQAMSQKWDLANQILRDKLKDAFGISKRADAESLLFRAAAKLGAKDAQAMTTEQRVTVYHAIVSKRLSPADGSIKAEG
jgi:recombination protein RecT